MNLKNHMPNLGKDTLHTSIIQGLSSATKSISSMFFYDECGSKLFEEITRLLEYYLTRTEKSLLAVLAKELSPGLGNLDIVEIGSGDASKISILFKETRPEQRGSITYIPFDVSESAILNSSKYLIEEFPDIHVRGIVADFMTQLSVIPKERKRLFCFFGSTLGNLLKENAALFLKKLSSVMEPDESFILGIDLVKDKKVLENAYNDAQNITEKFNKNILNVINNLVETDFDPELFSHVAYYNEEHERIEMYLRAEKTHSISCPRINRQ